MINGNATPTAVKGRVRISKPNVKPAVGRVIQGLIFDSESTKSSQASMKASDKNNENGWDSKDGEFIKKNGEERVRKAAKSAVHRPNILLPSR